MAVYIFCNVLPHNWLRRLKPFRSRDRSSIYIFYSKETFYLLPKGVIFIFHFESPLCARIKKRVSLCFIEKGPLPLESLRVHRWILFSFVQKFSQFPHWRRHSCAKSEICDLISQPAFTVFTLNQIIQHIRMLKVFPKSLTAILETLFKIYGTITSIWKWYGFSFSDVWSSFEKMGDIEGLNQFPFDHFIHWRTPLNKSKMF